VEPIPESVEAIQERDAVMEDDDILERLRDASLEVQRIVPDCIGLSVASVLDDLVVTLVATDPEIALLDAMQYLGHGPCVAAVSSGHVVELNNQDLLDEEEWRIFALASAARSVASTLTLPMLEDGHVVGSINLYAASGHAFGGHHEELAALFGAWAPGAVENADLSFSTRLEAERAPARMRDRARIDTAVGLFAGREGLSTGAALARLEDAATRGGVSLTRIAQAVITLFGGDP
jgi:GAF domain-containing protein